MERWGLDDFSLKSVCWVQVIYTEVDLTLNCAKHSDFNRRAVHTRNLLIDSVWLILSLLADMTFTGLMYACQVAQSCLTLCDPMDCSPLGSFFHGILQARILEWVAISFSRESSQPTDWTHRSNPRLLHFLHWQGNSLPTVVIGIVIYKEWLFPSLYS